MKALEHFKCNHGGDRHVINTSDHFRAGVLPLYVDELTCNYTCLRKNSRLCYDPYSCIFYFYSRSITEIRRSIAPRSKLYINMVGFEKYMYKDDLIRIVDKSFSDRGIEVIYGQAAVFDIRLFIVNRMLLDCERFTDDLVSTLGNMDVTPHDIWVVPIFEDEIDDDRLPMFIRYSRLMLGIANGSKTNMFCIVGGNGMMNEEIYSSKHLRSKISWYDHRVRGMRLYNDRCRDCDMIWNFCRIPIDDDDIDSIADTI